MEVNMAVLKFAERKERVTKINGETVTAVYGPGNPHYKY